jgi:hypothetical protein
MFEIGSETKQKQVTPQGSPPSHVTRNISVDWLPGAHAVCTPPSSSSAWRRALGNRAIGHMLQAKLAINQPGDAYEREADRAADQVMKSVVGPLAPVMHSPTEVQRKCEACATSGTKCSKCEAEEKEAALQRKEAAPGVASNPRAAPAIVHDVLNSPGQPLPRETRALYESRLGFDFSRVRVHADAEAAQSASAVKARAYTVGPHIVFAGRQYQPETDGGKWLLAHELAHVVQQNAAAEIVNQPVALRHDIHGPEERSVLQREPDGSLTAALKLDRRASVQLQRQVPIPGQTEREPDPGCPPEKPYRIAPKVLPGPGDYAVVPACSATPIPTTPAPANPLAPDTSGGTQPTQPEPSPPVAQPAPPASPTQPAPPTTGEAQPQRPAGKGAPDSYDFTDDPLADFDDGSSTIRVRPGPVRTTLIRPRPVTVKPPITDCDSLFEFKNIAEFGGKNFGPWDGAAVAKTVDATFQACPLAYVSISVRENPNGDDPHGDAVERAINLENDLINRIGPEKYTPDRYYAGSTFSVPGSTFSSEPAEIEVDLASKGKVSPGTGSGNVTPGTGGSGEVTPGTPAKPTTQISGQAGFGGVRHFYTTPARPNDALHEWVVQAQAAITKQLHAKNKSGREEQLFVQAQYSQTTKQWTITVGGQVAEVFQLSEKFQASFFSQLQFGQNVSASQAQAAAAVGAQIQWQPADWFAIVGQGAGGPVSQPGGPSSVDLGFTISIQVMK